MGLKADESSSCDCLHTPSWLNSRWRKEVNSIHCHPCHQTKHLWWNFLPSGWSFMHCEVMAVAQAALVVGDLKGQVFRSRKPEVFRRKCSPNQSFCISNVCLIFPLFLPLKCDLGLCLWTRQPLTDSVLWLWLRTPDTKAYTSVKNELCRWIWVETVIYLMLTILMDSCLTKTGLDSSFDKEVCLPPRVPLEREFIALNQCLAHWTNQFVYHHHFVICSVEN